MLSSANKRSMISITSHALHVTLYIHCQNTIFTYTEYDSLYF